MSQHYRGEIKRKKKLLQKEGESEVQNEDIWVFAARSVREKNLQEPMTMRQKKKSEMIS